MKNAFTAKTSIVIDAPRSKVWEALIDPVQVKQYLFGTDMKTDWKVGSPITYTGSWEGKPYEDKWTVLAFEPENRIETTYWSGFSGLADVPENYQKVSYLLSDVDGGTELKLIQENIASEEVAKHSEENWSMVFKKMKEMLEG